MASGEASAVVYEIGFAIGRRKRAYLILHQARDGDKAVARGAGIFDTLGYHEYSNPDDRVRRLTSNIDPEPLSFSPELDHRAPVYLVEESRCHCDDLSVDAASSRARMFASLPPTRPYLKTSP
jgi:hypothetical protein